MAFYVRAKCCLYYVFKIETLDMLYFIGYGEDLNSWVCSVFCVLGRFYVVFLELKHWICSIFNFMCLNYLYVDVHLNTYVN